MKLRERQELTEARIEWQRDLTQAKVAFAQLRASEERYCAAARRAARRAAVKRVPEISVYSAAEKKGVAA